MAFCAVVILIIPIYIGFTSGWEEARYQLLEHGPLLLTGGTAMFFLVPVVRILLERLERFLLSRNG
jgi:hypothetical protein